MGLRAAPVGRLFKALKALNSLPTGAALTTNNLEPARGFSPRVQTEVRIGPLRGPKSWWSRSDHIALREAFRPPVAGLRVIRCGKSNTLREKSSTLREMGTTLRGRVTQRRRRYNHKLKASALYLYEVTHANDAYLKPFERPAVVTKEVSRPESTRSLRRVLNICSLARVTRRPCSLEIVSVLCVARCLRHRQLPHGGQRTRLGRSPTDNVS